MKAAATVEGGRQPAEFIRRKNSVPRIRRPGLVGNRTYRITFELLSGMMAINMDQTSDAQEGRKTTGIAKRSRLPPTWPGPPSLVPPTRRLAHAHNPSIMRMSSSTVLRGGQRARVGPARPMHFRNSFKLKRRPVVAVSPSRGPVPVRVHASSSLEESVSGMPPAPPTPASYVNHCNAEYGIDYLVD